MAKPTIKLRYYLMDEVCIHNKKTDFWIVIHKNVFDLTRMIEDRRDHWNRVRLPNPSPSARSKFIDTYSVIALEHGLSGGTWRQGSKPFFS